MWQMISSAQINSFVSLHWICFHFFFFLSISELNRLTTGTACTHTTPIRLNTRFYPFVKKNLDLMLVSPPLRAQRQNKRRSRHFALNRLCEEENHKISQPPKIKRQNLELLRFVSASAFDCCTSLEKIPVVWWHNRSQNNANNTFNSWQCAQICAFT